MKILHISGARSWGGNEQQLLYVVEELHRYGVEQFLFCYEDTPLFHKIKTYPIKVIAIPYVKAYKKMYRKSLKAIVEEHQYNLLHLHTSDAVTGYVISDLFTKLNTKTVFSKKGVSRKISVLSRYKYNYKNIHKILCVSKVVQEHFKTVLSSKNQSKLCIVYDGVNIKEATTVTNSIDLKEQLQLTEDTKIIGNIANHTAAKDLQTLIETLRVLVHEKKEKNIHLVQIGEFTKRTEALQQLVTEYKLEAYVSFLGFMEEASAVLPQFSVYIMTSEREGGPTTVLEALYKKIPVISTNVGIVSEAITDGHNGFVTPIGAYDILADKTSILIHDTVLRETFATRSYEKFMNSYTAQQLGENTFKVYQDIVNSTVHDKNIIT